MPVIAGDMNVKLGESRPWIGPCGALAEGHTQVARDSQDLLDIAQSQDLCAPKLLEISAALLYPCRKKHQD